MSNIHALFGRRLRHLRTNRGVTQQQLGDKAELSFKYLGAIERGEENPSLRVIGQLSVALGVEPRDMLVFEHEETTSAALKKQLNHLLKEADVARLQQAVKLLRALIR